MLLSEHVYCVAITFKMTEWVEQQICIRFCVKLQHSCAETIRWFRRPQLWARADWQLHHDNVPAHASHLMQFFGETSNYPGDSAPLQPRFGTLWLLTFPKTKITFEKEEISDCQWDSGKYHGAPDCDPIKDFAEFWTVEETLGELCEVPRCLLWKGLKHHCPMYNVSCILYLQ